MDCPDGILLPWIAKRFNEDALSEGVELGEGGAALGAQGLGLVQDRCDAALLGEGWERNSSFLDNSV